MVILFGTQRDYSKNKVHDFINKMKDNLIQDLSECIQMSREDTIKLLKDIWLSYRSGGCYKFSEWLYEV